MELDKQIIQEFKSKISELYRDKLKDVILYGSFARGEGTKDSDIDLAVILKGEIQQGLEIDHMIDIINDINLKYDVLLGVYPCSEENYLNRKAPILMNIRKEGVLV